MTGRNPGTVTWTVMESGFSAPGSCVSASFSRRGTGSRIHVTWDRRPTGATGWIVLGLIVLTRGMPVRQSLMAGLRAIAKEPPSPLPPTASI
jgi:hypothetical protein